MHDFNPHEIPGRVTVVSGKGDLPVIHVETDHSMAQIYPHGAHVTGFQLKGESPLLFMSEASEFRAGKPIRGGVPVIFPWFGPREGLAAHGFARLADWDLLESLALPDDSIRLVFHLPSDEECEVKFVVTVGTSLTMELAVTNTGTSDFTFEGCLHTYFLVGDIRNIEITGLQGARYLDLLRAAEFTETAEPIRISAEMDRTYLDTAATVEIHDPELRRSIRIRKSGSMSTVVWNPWIDKSRRMPDFGDDEYLRMVCVESGNIAANAVTLAPGEQSSMKVEIESIRH